MTTRTDHPIAWHTLALAASAVIGFILAVAAVGR